MQVAFKAASFGIGCVSLKGRSSKNRVNRASCIQPECGEGNNRLILFLPLKFVRWFKSAELNFKHSRGDKMWRYDRVAFKVKETSERFLLYFISFILRYTSTFSPLVWAALSLALNRCWVMMESYLNTNCQCISLDACLLLLFSLKT